MRKLPIIRAAAWALVLYYEHVGHFNGIVPIGMFEDLAAVRDQEDGFTATLDVAL